MNFSRTLGFSIMIALAELAFAGALFAKAAPLADRVDAVVIKGGMLPSELLGFDIESYRVFALQGSRLSVIPMQIDECGPDGAILLKQGPQGGEGDGKFDPADELAFMARDAGGPLPPVAPKGCDKTAALAIKDEAAGAEGHVLVAFCQDPPPLSSKRYARYDAEERMVSTERYSLGWKKAAVYYYDHISINNSPDMLDRLKVRCTVGKWGLQYTFDEEFFKNRFLGFTDGPVRVVWHSENYWSLGPLGKLRIPSHSQFFSEYAVLENPMDVRFNPAILGLDFNVLIAHDLNLEEGRGYSMCANTVPDCVPLGPELSGEMAEAMAAADMVWGGIKGPQGALITHFVPDPGLTLRVVGSLKYGEEVSDPPEYHPGCMPLLGFNLINWKDVKREVYDLTFYHFFIDRYSVEEYKRIDRLVTEPLEIKVENNIRGVR